MRVDKYKDKEHEQFNNRMERKVDRQKFGTDYSLVNRQNKRT